MVERYEIVSDAATMTITVGPKVFNRPRLWPLPERDTGWKQEICPDCPEYKIKDVWGWYAARLGSKFNRRFRAAHYWLWVGDKLTTTTANMLRRGGRHWFIYSDTLVWRANQALPYINEAERDGLHHLIPAIVTFGQSPKDIRRALGPASWRRVAHNSLTRNKLIMQAVERHRSEDEPCDAAQFVRMLDLPSSLLPLVVGATPDEMVAARITPKKEMMEFIRTQHIVRDTRDMLGALFNEEWSLARMEREHADAVKDLARKQYSDKRFAAAWSFSEEGFTATLLTSKLDIATEGAVQHHCVASYAKHAARGAYAVFRIEGKERATAGIVTDGGGRVDQVYGACNDEVSEACRSFAYRMAVEYFSAQRKAA